MPRRRAAWSSWNFHLAERAARADYRHLLDEPPAAAAGKRNYFLTLNRDEEIDPAKVLRRFTYDHPVYTAAGVAAQARHAEVSGVDRTHYCGAYWGWGFHEDGVVSGLRVCEELASGARCARLASRRGRAPPTARGRPTRAAASRRGRRGGARRLIDSAIYEGWVRHRRFEPVDHSLPLPLLPHLPGPRRAARRPRPLPALLGPPPRPRPLPPRRLPRRPGAPAGRVRRATSSSRHRRPRPAGPVRLLTGLRYLGHSFNPVSFYYCFDPTGRRVEAVVAEVENIPWGERHAYVLERGDREGTVLADELEKTHHVSPLMGMDQTYSFRASEPGERLQVHIESRPRAGEGTPGRGTRGRARAAKTFDATLVAPPPRAQPVP